MRIENCFVLSGIEEKYRSCVQRKQLCSRNVKKYFNRKGEFTETID